MAARLSHFVYWKRLAGLARLSCVGPDLAWLLTTGLRAWHLSLAALEVTRKALLLSFFSFLLTCLAADFSIPRTTGEVSNQETSPTSPRLSSQPIVLSYCFLFLGGGGLDLLQAESASSVVLPFYILPPTFVSWFSPPHHHKAKSEKATWGGGWGEGGGYVEGLGLRKRSQLPLRLARDTRSLCEWARTKWWHHSMESQSLSREKSWNGNFTTPQPQVLCPLTLIPEHLRDNTGGSTSWILPVRPWVPQVYNPISLPDHLWRLLAISLKSCFTVSMLRIPENERGEGGRTWRSRWHAALGLDSAGKMLQRLSPRGPTFLKPLLTTWWLRVKDIGRVLASSGTSGGIHISCCHAVKALSSEGRKASRQTSRRKNRLSHTQISPISAAEKKKKKQQQLLGQE